MAVQCQRGGEPMSEYTKRNPVHDVTAVRYPSDVSWWRANLTPHLARVELEDTTLNHLLMIIEILDHGLA
jgi:hypothetical protein